MMARFNQGSLSQGDILRSWLVRSKSAFFIILIIFCSTHAWADYLDVYLIGGQSNADGRGKRSDLPTELNQQMPLPFYFNVEGAHNLEGTFIDLQPGSPEPFQPNLFGPEIGLGDYLLTSYADRTDRTPVIVKYANGGTNLQTHWAPGGVDRIAFRDTVDQAIDELAISNPNDTINIIGFAWMQGEADASIGGQAALDYQTNLENLIAELRNAYNPNLRVAIGRLSSQQTSISDLPGFDIVRSAQDDIGQNISNVTVVDTDSFSVKSDEIHFDSSGQLDLGYAFGHAFDLLETQLYDLDRDGDVDDSDFGLLFAAFSGPNEATDNIAADFDGDGDTDDADFGLAFAAFTGPGSTAGVPEPTSLILLGLGIAAIIIRRSNQKVIQIRDAHIKC